MARCAFAQKFPSPPWETHVLLVVCRAAVSMSRLAQWPSHGAPSVGTELALCVLMFKSSHHVQPVWDSHMFCSCASRVVVSLLLSMEAQWPSHRAPSVETQLMCALMFKSSHRPDGRNADVLGPTHACTTTNALVNYRMYVPQRT